MGEKQKITEEMGIHKEWYEEARKMTLEKLPEFLRKVTEDYGHDYGTICHAIASSAIAAAWAVEKSPQGGITGFQAGAIMWEMIKGWMPEYRDVPARILNYSDLLYPQMADKFTVISSSTWDWVQKKAREHISKSDEAYAKYLKDKERYDSDIGEFVKKHPDYHERREYYDHLGMGNSDEWAAYEKKKKDGFEFAPREPVCPKPHNAVIEHWRGIVDGKVPFGLLVKKEED